LRKQVNRGSSSNSIEKLEVNVDAEDFGPISFLTKDSSLGRREMESLIVNIISTLHIEKGTKIFFNIKPPAENTLNVQSIMNKNTMISVNM
jgi:hypothetical protein